MKTAEDFLSEAIKNGLKFSDVLSAFASKNTLQDKDLILKARERHEREGELEIDDVTVVSRADGDEGKRGAYVLAWLWVDQDEQDE